MQETFTQFVSKTKNKFYCHRTGFHKDIDIKERDRQMNLKNSCKIAGHCTCYISIDEKREKRKTVYKMKYVKTHYGHTIELAHLRISSEDKMKKASEINIGVPNQTILNQIRKSDFPLVQKLIDAKDVRNISVEYDVQFKLGHRDPNEIISLLAAIEHHKDSIIGFKQGEFNPDFPLLNKEDFFLAYANPEMVSQAKEFLNQENSLIAIDATYGLNTCDFLLIVVITTDYSRNAYPIMFLISNREDYTSLKYFFQNFVNRYGELFPKYFMSDDANQYYSSFVNTMCSKKNVQNE